MTTATMPVIDDAIGLNAVADEIREARKKHAPLNSAHEAYSVILEELDEFWDEVKRRSENRDVDNMAKELVQIAAMAVRAITDLRLSETVKEMYS